MGPISSSNRNGSKSENEALGKGRRTRKPPPSKVSILLTMPDTVRLPWLVICSSLNTSIDCILLPSFGNLSCHPCRLVITILIGYRYCFVADLFQQPYKRLALL